MKGGVPHHHYIKSNKGFPKEAFVLYEVILLLHIAFDVMVVAAVAVECCLIECLLS